MNYLDYTVRDNANKLHSVIKQFEHYFPEEFSKTDIHRCGHCNATGLKDKHTLEFCDYCGGTGYVGYEKVTRSYTCRGCNGAGCNHCNQTGMTDWISHANGRDIEEGWLTKRRG